MLFSASYQKTEFVWVCGLLLRQNKLDLKALGATDEYSSNCLMYVYRHCCSNIKKKTYMMTILYMFCSCLPVDRPVSLELLSGLTKGRTGPAAVLLITAGLYQTRHGFPLCRTDCSTTGNTSLLLSNKIIKKRLKPTDEQGRIWTMSK